MTSLSIDRVTSDDKLVNRWRNKLMTSLAIDGVTSVAGGVHQNFIMCDMLCPPTYIFRILSNCSF